LGLNLKSIEELREGGSGVGGGGILSGSEMRSKRDLSSDNRLLGSVNLLSGRNKRVDIEGGIRDEIVDD
jgi:hypothetical protein